MRHSTKNLLNWKPEAEGERQQMSRLYTDLLGLEDAVNNNEFIIMGRKGSGKSAYAVHLQALAENPENMISCESINPHEIQLERLINVVDDGTTDYTALLEWLILTKFVSLILGTKDGKQNKNYQDLAYFYKNTSGHIEFTKDTIVETIREREFNISALNSINAKAGKQTVSKNYKAPFLTMVNSLRDVVCETLSMDVYRKYTFYILIDDLDIDFSLKDSQSKQRLLSLLRIVCKYNTNYLLGTSSKILIFVRNDIANKISAVGGDSQKLLDSYGYCINWYRNTDEENFLYKLINHRLFITFVEKDISIPDGVEPWQLFAEDGYQQFKKILDSTFYLPRDIINILNKSKDKNWTLPLSDKQFSLLINEYAPSKFEEICNELAASFNGEEIFAIKNVLYKIASENRDRGDYMTYDRVLELLFSKNLNEEHFYILVEHDLLVPVDNKNNLYFSYRKKKMYGTYDEYSYALPKVLYDLFCNN